MLESLKHKQIRKLTFKIIHLITIILPVWHAILKELKLADCIMPRDVTTQWNSTFEMLNFAINYCAALDKITSDRILELHEYELSNSEWAIAKQLHNVLKVCHSVPMPQMPC